jgi:hypothetical protein
MFGKVLLLLYLFLFNLWSSNAIYTLPGLLSFQTLKAENPEIQKLPNINQASAGFCLQNSVSDYTQFYPQVSNSTNPFQNCNGANQYNFDAINMTLMARINLISLTTDGFAAFSNNTDFEGTCKSRFPDYCYFVMWFFNVKAGFRCVNNGQLPNGNAILPTCKNTCKSLLFDSCNMFESALKQQGESDWMLCEYFSNSNCYAPF